MVKAKDRSIDDYIGKMETHLLKKYPSLQFDIVKWNEREATIYYTPYSEENEYPIIKRIGNILTDALVDGGYRIYIIPAA